MKNHLSLLLLMLFAGMGAYAQDTTAPVLNHIYIDTNVVPLGGTITITIDATDDLAGLNLNGVAGFVSTLTWSSGTLAPDSGTAIGFDTWTHLSGNLYTSTVTFGMYTNTGHWKIGDFTLVDRAGNQSYYSYGNNFTVDFTVANNRLDSLPPVLNSITFDRDTVNNDSIITVYIDAYDPSGVMDVGVSMSRDSFTAVTANAVYPDSIVGQTFIKRYLIPHWARTGRWSIFQLTLIDSVGNFSNYVPTTNWSFTVVSSNIDTTPPVFSNVQVQPSIAHRGDTLLITVTVIDSLSGVDSFSIGGVYSNAVYQQFSNFYPRFLTVSGNTYTAQLIVGDYAANGVWRMAFIAADFAGNTGISVIDTFFTIEDDAMVKIQGNARQSNGTPLANSKVYLVKESPADSLLYVLHITNTDSSGNYVFRSETHDSLVYLKAIPDTSLTTELPTYLDSSVLFTGAHLVHIDTALVQTMDTIHTMAGANPGGFGFLIGYVSQGAGKVGAVGDPKQNLGLVLVDSLGNFVTGTVTDSTGHFRINHLANDTYKLYTDLPKINNTIAPTITIDGSHPNANVLNFSLHERYLERLIEGVEELKEGSLSVAPNPSNGMCVIILDASISGYSTLQIYNTLGEIVSTTSFVSDGTVQYRGIDISAYATGIYLAKLTTPQGGKTVKFVKE